MRRWGSRCPRGPKRGRWEARKGTIGDRMRREGTHKAHYQRLTQYDAFQKMGTMLKLPQSCCLVRQGDSVSPSQL